MAMADLAWWFGWEISEMNEMLLQDLQKWIEQANRQIKAGYTKAML